VRREHTEISDEVKARRRDDRSDAAEQIVGLEQDRDGAVAPGLLQAVAELAARELLQAFLRDRRPAEVAAEPLEPGAVARADGDGGMDVEPRYLAHRLVGAREERVDDAEQGAACAVTGEREASGGGCVAGGEHGLVVGQRVVLGGAFEGAAVLLEDLLHAASGAAGHVLHVGAGGCGERVERERALRSVAHVHAVEGEGVYVDVEPEGRVRPLHDGDGAGVHAGDGAEAELTLGAVPERAAHLPKESGDHVGAELPVVAEHGADPPRHRANPLADRRFGEDLLLEVDGHVGHSPPQAARAEPPALAGERHEALEPARAARDAQAALLETATPQVLLELPDHELRQPAVLLRLLPERWPVPLDRAVEHRLLGPVALVPRGA